MTQEQIVQQAFRDMAKQGLLDAVLHVTREIQQEAELTFRGQLLEGDVVPDGPAFRELCRQQGAARVLARLLTIFKTHALPPPAPEPPDGE